MEENADGLFVESPIVDTALGTDVLKLLRAGVITELSIGFDAKTWEMVDEGAAGVVRYIKDLELWEISLVTLAANRDAKVMAVHSLQEALQMTPELAAEILPIIEAMGRSEDATSALLLPVQRISELHVGKVLSSKNRSLVQNAIDALTLLVKAADKDEEDDEGMRLSLAVVDRDITAQLRDLNVAYLGCLLGRPSQGASSHA